MEIRRSPHGSADYYKGVELRQKLLRLPLGLDFTFQELENESCDVFLVAFEGEDVIATLVLTTLDVGVLKMRQVAVAEEYQGRGIGTELVKESEAIGKETGFERMVLSARLPAVTFYERLGYEVVGDEFVEVGIPHRHMEKALS
jgi:predicted GNAT family N-acyltransferase